MHAISRQASILKHFYCGLKTKWRRIDRHKKAERNKWKLWKNCWRWIPIKIRQHDPNKATDLLPQSMKDIVNLDYWNDASSMVEMFNCNIFYNVRQFNAREYRYSFCKSITNSNSREVCLSNSVSSHKDLKIGESWWRWHLQENDNHHTRKHHDACIFVIFNWHINILVRQVL